MAEQSWSLGASVLLERWNGCPMIGRECTNAVGDVVTQGEGIREGKGPSVLFGGGWTDSPWAGDEGSQLGCSSQEEVAGETD